MDTEEDLRRKSCMATIPHKAMNRGVDITPVSNTETAQKVRHDGQHVMLAQTLKREQGKSGAQKSTAFKEKVITKTR